MDFCNHLVIWLAIVSIPLAICIEVQERVVEHPEIHVQEALSGSGESRERRTNLSRLVVLERNRGPFLAQKWMTDPCCNLERSG